jgi:hypothetical protein
VRDFPDWSQRAAAFSHWRVVDVSPLESLPPGLFMRRESPRRISSFTAPLILAALTGVGAILAGIAAAWLILR